MKHLVSPLAVLYCLASLAMLYCAITSQQHGSTKYCALFAGCAVLFGCAIAHHAYHRDELRFANVALVRASTPATPATDAVVAVAMAAACCERWWTSAGAEHEETCPKLQRNAS